jgi:peptidoglycan/LPS O-acetylase OafA/YrhL
VGLISYSLFLWHEPLVYWLRRHDVTLDGSAGFAFNLALLALVAGVLSAITYRWIELPALRRKSRSRADAIEPVPAHEVQAAP